MVGGGYTTPTNDKEGPGIYGGGIFDGGLFTGYDFGLFTGQVEFRLAGDDAYNIKSGSGYSYSPGSGQWVSNTDYIGYKGMLFQIPLVVKMDLHLWRLVLQPLAGIYLNVGLGQAERHSSNDTADWDNPLLGGILGGTLGLRIGRGFLFTEARFTSNFGKTVPKGTEGYTRSATTFTLGYQYYFRQR
jgi:hypothetical protein